MPKSKRFLNAFTKREVHDITGLSLPMIDYLEANGYLDPAYRDETRGVRTRDHGRVRYYSYRDLVIAHVVQKLRAAGVRLPKLKEAIKALDRDNEWTKVDRRDRIRWLVFDGKKVALRREDGFIEDLRTGQRSFTFVVGLTATIAEVTALIRPPERREMFSMQNRRLVAAGEGNG
ncbi:MerR family transcriptional regulator [Bradyrhizobium guangdongense]|uniref:helix-turn-helix domain-containing protein n=1 Tax=Bradyrhizobium guangdongense TaxID=1325090 RepID=UPI00131A1CA6|nr:MerR family transcriptional regulator [Bradyrhizobium guangdongense]